jgi:pimeloyl-ACP methyl ester carboxylesterase
LARTFQKIRLFRNLTVLGNVIAASHIHHDIPFWQYVIHGRPFARDHARAREQALQLLGFVGLESRAEALASSLAYGERRMLELARALATAPRLLMVDEPAAGLNAAEVERLVDRIAPKRAVLLGHSMGGMVALEAWAWFPHKIAGLILSGTTAAFGRPDGAWQEEFLRQRLGPLDAGRSMADLASSLVRGMVAPDADPAAVEFAENVMSAVPPTTYREALHALMSFDRRALLPSISVPTLALSGEVDPIAPPAVMQKMAEKIPGAMYECLPRAGHLASVERPEPFNDAVLRFLKTRL